MTERLAEKRREASAKSLGASSSRIYDLFESLVIHMRLGGEVLDYGAGTGHLTQKLVDLGCFDQVSAADMMPRPKEVSESVRWIETDLNLEEGLSGHFDVILSPEVIEHLENPRAVARTWKKILKPGGTLIFSTPNNESLRAFLSLLVNGHYIAFVGNEYPAHITALLRRDMDRILREAEFESWSFKYSGSGKVPKMGNLTWQGMSLGLLRGRLFSDNVIVVAKKGM